MTPHCIPRLISILSAHCALRSAIVSILLANSLAAGPDQDYPIRPVPFTEVRITDGLWASRIDTNRRVTVWYDLRKCEETGRIDNFAKAGGLMDGSFRGIRFDDSDVFKVVEGAAYSLATRADPELDRYLDGLIAKIAAAQEGDGYLYTCRTIDPENLPAGAGAERWSSLVGSHELYNIGHLYEAAVAHHRATAKRSLLDVAIRSADLVDLIFGPEKTRDVPGHEEIEIGLVKLFRVTGEERYLLLAKFFLDERGRAHGRRLMGPNVQDHMPVVEQREAVGHAVRAGYLYCGMADVAALTGDEEYLRAIDHIWEDVVTRKMYLTGGVGSTGHGEAFGQAYELPNDTAYNETCAAIANALWNHRMFLLHGEGKFIDILERVLYNGFLSGVSLSGDRFFYPNPLACDGRRRFNHGSMERSAWFGCSCCPVNIVRFIPSIPGLVYAVRDRVVYVNLFAGGTGRVSVGDGELRLRQETRYPWDGAVTIHVEPDRTRELEIRVRIPGWARGEPVPGDLYRYAATGDDVEPDEPDLRVNGERVDCRLERGYAILSRPWSSGDEIHLRLPMPVRRVLCHDAVEANRGRVAVERGPVVYCLEGVDHDGRVLDLFLPDSAAFSPPVHRDDLLGGVTVLRAAGRRVLRQEDGTVRSEPTDLELVPYNVWAHRGAGQMVVWIPRSAVGARPAPRPTLASRSHVSASHVWSADTPEAVNDQVEPASSGDHGLPRHTWWDHRGTREWIQYDFPGVFRVSAVEVYWFDDTGRGQCRLPGAWRLLHRSAHGWKPVSGVREYPIVKDGYSKVTFDPVMTGALRLDVELRPGFSGGVLEWVVR